MILHVPHASRALTRAARQRILLDDPALAAELDRMTDAHTDLIAYRVRDAAVTAPWLFLNRYSRLVVDPERFPDDREELLAVGMGAVYTHTSQGGRLRAEDRKHTEELLATHFEPYAAAMAALVDERLAATGHAVLIDVHSYPSRPLPYELHGAGPRPAICLGTDPYHTPAALLDTARQALSRCGDVDVDTPFSGCYVPLRQHRRQRAVTALMVEIRRDVYLTEPSGPPTDGIDGVIEALTLLVDTVVAGV